MRKVKNNKVKKAKQASGTLLSLLDKTIAELKLSPHDYVMIGAGSHHHQSNPFASDPATRSTLCSYMVVDTATYMYITTTLGLIPMKHKGYDLATLAGDGPSGSGGIVFVCTSNGLSFHNTLEVIEQFLHNMIDFSSMLNGAVSLNIMAYLAAANPTKVKFLETCTMEWVKARLMRKMRTRGGEIYESLFCEPSYIYEGINLVNNSRETPGWKTPQMLPGFITPVSLEGAYDHRHSLVCNLESSDPDCLEMNRRAKEPGWMSPSEMDMTTMVVEDQFHIEPVEPDETVVQRVPYELGELPKD